MNKSLRKNMTGMVPRELPLDGATLPGSKHYEDTVAQPAVNLPPSKANVSYGGGSSCPLENTTAPSSLKKSRNPLVAKLSRYGYFLCSWCWMNQGRLCKARRLFSNSPEHYTSLSGSPCPSPSKQELFSVSIFWPILFLNDKRLLRSRRHLHPLWQFGQFRPCSWSLSIWGVKPWLAALFPIDLAQPLTNCE